MDKFPDEIILKIIFQVDVDQFFKFICLNKKVYNLYISNKYHILKKILEYNNVCIYDVSSLIQVITHSFYKHRYEYAFKKYLRLFKLTEVNVTYKKVKSIPYLPNLTELKVGSEAMLNHNLLLPNLENLYCNNINQDVFNNIDFTVFKKLKILCCQHIGSIKLPYISTLEYLNCAGNNIINDRIPMYPKLVYLDCSGCVNINDIPLIKSLVKLNCNYTSTSEIKKYPNLEELDCSFCELTKLPNIKHLKYLKCSGNIGIIKIPKYKFLVELNCSRCSVKTIPHMDTLKYIYIYTEMD